MQEPERARLAAQRTPRHPRDDRQSGELGAVGPALQPLDRHPGVAEELYKHGGVQHRGKLRLGAAGHSGQLDAPQEHHVVAKLIYKLSFGR